ncbi:MAG: OmpA family protein [Myxococcales bacterium]|nr:OmpA family protein [Myxococcales bacterium]
MGDGGGGRTGKDVVPEVRQTDPARPGERVSFGPVYFEFDSALLTEAGRAELARAADYLARASDQLTIEGHTDERGTTEYNLALGQQRATTVAAYLQRLGVPAARIETITYGEERPAVTGGDDGAWTRNRRAEFVLRP